MDNINIALVDGTLDGTIIMSSMSKVKVVRVAKEDVPKYKYNDLDGPGVYFLLVGASDVYVGQTALDPVATRIVNTHSGKIDSLWHHVVGFVFPKKTVTANEFLYMENAMCEYVYKHFAKCLTTNPSKKNCNLKYRNEHYGLSYPQIQTCKQYISDIEWFLSCFPGGVFPKAFAAHKETTVAGTKFFCKSESADATAILTKENKLVVLKGSHIAEKTTNSCPVGTLKLREELKNKKVVVDWVFQNDWEAPSFSSAAKVVLGRSESGNRAWITEYGKRLGDLIKEGDKSK